MFKALTDVYKNDTETQRNQLMSEFFGFKYNKSVDMMNNISAIQNIAFRLNSVNVGITDEMIMNRFLLTLPEEYNHFSSAWESTPSTGRKLENLKSRLFLEEERIKGKKEEPKVAFKANFNKNSGNKGNKQNQNNNNQNNNNAKKTVKCFKCGGPHYVSNCNNNKKEENQETTTACNICSNRHGGECYFTNGPLPICQWCKGRTHPEYKCRFKPSYMQGRNNNNNNSNGNKAAFYVDINENNAAAGSKNQLDSVFVVDSGCNSHLTKEKKLLVDSKKIEELAINVAKKGQQLQANLQGNIDTEKVLMTGV